MTVTRLGFDTVAPIERTARAEILKEGSGRSMLWEHANMGMGAFTVGTWEGEDMLLEVGNYPQNELFVVIQGCIELTADGETERFEAGDAAFVRKGWKGQWRNVGKPRKFYAILKDEPNPLTA